MTEYNQKTKWYKHELFQRHIHKLKFYQSAENFILLVTNIICGVFLIFPDFIKCYLISSDVIRHYLILPDVIRCYQIIKCYLSCPISAIRHQSSIGPGKLWKGTKGSMFLDLKFSLWSRVVSSFVRKYTFLPFYCVSCSKQTCQLWNER